MASFDKGPNLRTPFGKNVFLRSTKDFKPESYTVAASTVTAETIDGATGQKVLQPGQAMAKITSGTDTGKVGPMQLGTRDREVQTITVTASGGTYTISFDGETTGDLAFDATASTVQAALLGLASVEPGDITVTGGVGNVGGTTPYTLTFGGRYTGVNPAQVTTDATNLTGGAHTAVAATAAQVGATDGRGDAKNFVGFNNTFLPWQLMDRDVEIAVLYECAVVQANCFEYDTAGARIALTDNSVDAINRLAGKSTKILFK